MEGIPNPEKEIAVPTGTSIGAPHTQPGVSRLRGARTPDVGKVSASQPDRWTSPRENRTGVTRPNRWKVTFQDEDSKDKRLPPNDMLCHY